MNNRLFFSLTLSISTLAGMSARGQGAPPAAPGAPPSIAAESDAPAPEEPAAEVERPAPAFTITTPAPSMMQPAASQRGKLQTFAFESAPLEVVMEEYARWTDKIFLKTDQVSANITLKADRISTEESIKVVEAILAMNNIALIPMGDKYLKVMNATAGDLTGSGIEIGMTPEASYGKSSRFITQIVPLKNVEIQEVQAAVQHVMHAYGKIMALQRSNSLMITDTEDNVRRAMEIISFIDQATSPIESRIYKIEHAEATEIAAKLNEIVSAAQGDQKTTSTSRTTTTRATGVIRAGTRTTATRTPAAPTKASIGATEGASATIIHGNVQVLADERTNIIIIFSQKENFEFFDKIMKVLDVEVDPSINFEVINLEYADALDMSGTLNDLVGAATGSSGSSRSSASSRSSSSRNSGVSRAGSSSRTSGSSSRTSSSRSSSTGRVSPNAVGGESAINNLARLSENTKILPDERTNSIILMGEKGDIAALKAVIKKLDVMLEQVVIEAAIFEIGLSDSLRHGIDWLYRAQDDERIGAWDGNSLITNAIQNVASGAFSYYQNLAGIDSKILINLAASDNDARLVSTPNITTTDNTEATLRVGEQRPVVTSTDSFANSSGTQRSNYEYKDIGIELVVTPRINPRKYVVMELQQRADQLGGNVDIDGNQVPIILNREFNAVVTVPNGNSVILGGLINNELSDDVTKIPLLGDIPLLGRYLFSSVSKTEVQRELLVIMTPSVMTNADDMRAQTERLYQGTTLKQEDWQDNWSASPLKDIPDPEPVVEEEQ